MPDTDVPVLIFAGGADTLHLSEDGKTYRPGDVLPKLSQQRKNALRTQGIHLTTRHATTAAPAIAAWVEPSAVVTPPADRPEEESAPRASRKG